MRNISWKGKTQFLGRNGYFACSGFEFRRIQYSVVDEVQWPGYLNDVVRVYPVTTKGKAGRCFIEIPTKSVGVFLKALRAEARSRERRVK